MTGDRAETASWCAAALLLAGMYAYGAVEGAGGAFGIDALGRWPRAAALTVIGAALLAGAAVGWFASGVEPSRVSRTGPLIPMLAALASAPFLFVWRTSFVNPDGLQFATKFGRDVPLLGAHATHDEMLELYLHSRFWYYTHGWWGWTVERSYQVLSCLAGAVFVYVVLRLAPRLAPRSSWLLVAGALAGGYLQLFFGDVENYTLTAALVAIYLTCAVRFLAGEAPLWLPSAALAVAMLFHLLAAWLLPSLWYLASVSRARQGSRREWAASAGVGAGLATAALAYMHVHGLPLERIVSSHAARAVRVATYSYFVLPSLDPAIVAYYREQLNLLLLLCPAVVMLPSLAVWRRLAPDTVGRFLLIAASSMLLFQLVWKAQLGVYDDWNLYAVGALVLGVALWRSVVLAAVTPARRAAACALAALAAVHTGASIMSNHVYGR